MDESLTTTEKYVLAQLLVSGDLDEGEFRSMNRMGRVYQKKVCRSLTEKGLIGPDGVRENPMESQHG